MERSAFSIVCFSIDINISKGHFYLWKFSFNCLNNPSYVVRTASRPFNSLCDFFNCSLYNFLYSLLMSAILTLVAVSQNLLNSLCCSRLYYLCFMRLYTVRSWFSLRYGDPMALMRVLHMRSRDDVKSVFSVVKYEYKYYWILREFGLATFSSDSFWLIDISSSSEMTLWLVMWLWYFLIQRSQPAGYFHSQWSERQKRDIFSLCSQLCIILFLLQLWVS